jgi:hypothetical protein
MVEKPIVVLLLVRTFAPNALPQPLQNLIVADKRSPVLEAFVSQKYFALVHGIISEGFP